MSQSVNEDSALFHSARLCDPKVSKSNAKDSLKFILKNCTNSDFNEVFWFKVLELGIKYKFQEVIEIYLAMEKRHIYVNSVHMTGILTIGNQPIVHIYFIQK